MFNKPKTIYGIGIKDANPMNKFGRQKPSYTRWMNMFKRCYSGKYPTYKDTEVCEEWRSYSTFSKWFKLNRVKGLELDKDLKGDGTLYSPSTCCFITRRLNNLLIKAKNIEAIKEEIFTNNRHLIN